MSKNTDMDFWNRTGIIAVCTHEFMFDHITERYRCKKCGRFQGKVTQK